MAISIQGRFKKDDRPFDGLAPYADALADGEEHVVVGVVRAVRTAHSLEDGTNTTVVKFVHIELIEDEQDARDARDVLAGRYEARTGSAKPTGLFDDDDPLAQDPLPIDPQDAD